MTLLCVICWIILLFGRSEASAAPCSQAVSGIIGWWPGDGNPLTIVGNNNATLQGGATTSAPGFVGSAFGFDGTNNTVQIPDSPVLHPTNLTVEAWVLFTGLDSFGSGTSPAGDQYIVFKQNTRSSDFEGFDLSKTRVGASDVFRFLVASAAGQAVELHSTTTINTGVWYHVTAVRGTNLMQLFVNGNLQAQSAITFPQDYGATPWYFGTSGQSSYDHRLRGYLDEVSLYNRALSSNEISAIYLAGSSGKCKAVSIISPPQSQQLPPGTNATFSVVASGLSPLTYQWQFNATNISSATNASLTVTNVQATNSGSYQVVVSNVFGAVTSSVATLSVSVAPSISLQPQSATNVAGTTANFSVSANGTPAPSYQWLFNGAPLGGANSATLSLPNVQPVNAGNYSVVVTNAAGSVTSSVATLTVWVGPSISVQPQSATNIAGTTASFTVSASGTPAPSYQWLFNGAPLGGANSATLSLPNVQPGSAGSYSVVVTNAAGSITSSVATLTVWVGPSISSQPQSATNIAGTTASFTVSASGTPAPGFQWLFNGTPIANATAPSLSITNVQATNGGGYSVIVTNAAGAITSSIATLTIVGAPVITAQPQSITNVSGTTASFTVSASGSPAPVYQWWFNSTPIPSATGNSLFITNVQPANGGVYAAVASNSVGVVTSSIATLTVWVAPAITSQPQSSTNVIGSTASFFVSATGVPTPTYQWLYNGSAITNATNATLSLPGVQTSNSGSYAVVVANAVGGLLSSSATLTVVQPILVFADPNLEASVCAALSVTKGTLTIPLLQGLTNLFATHQNITNLSGLQFATNLARLALSGNALADVSSLASLRSLVDFRVDENRLVDLSPLAGLTSLTNFSCAGNFLTNCDTLSGLTNLLSVSLAGNTITNFAALQTLRQLQALDLRENLLEDISSVTNLRSLRTLLLDENFPSRFNSIAALTNLTTLSLSQCAATNLNFLQNLRRLVSVDVSGNPLTDLGPLSGLTNLTQLNLASTPATNYNVLAVLTPLTNLCLRAASVSDLSFLSSLRNLQSLNLEQSALKTLAPLSGLTNLTCLILNGNTGLTNFTSLSGLRNLTDLEFARSGLSNLSFVSNLSRLQFVDLSYNSVADLTALAGLTNLTGLVLSGNSVSNLSALATLPALQRLWLAGCGLSNATALAGFSQLTLLDLSDDRLADPAPVAGLANLDFLSLSRNPLASFGSLSALTNLSGLALDSASVSNIALNFLSTLRLTRLDLRTNALNDLSALAPLTNLAFLSVDANRLHNVSGLSNCTRLESVSITRNPLILDTTESQALANLQMRAAVEYLPTNSPPVLAIATNWIIAGGQSSALPFVTADDVTPSAELQLFATSPNPGVFPNLNLLAAAATNGGTLSVTPVGSNLTAPIDVTAIDDAGLSVTSRVMVSVLTATNLSTLYPAMDPALRSALSAAIGKPAANLTTVDMLGLTALYANGAGITNLSGLQLATNLISLFVAENAISSVAPLATMRSLTSLELSGTAVSNFAPLAGLTNLLSLSAIGNSISNITFITNFPALIILVLDNNRVSDLSPLAVTTNLQLLSVDHNLVGNIDVLTRTPMLSTLTATRNLLDTTSPFGPLRVIGILTNAGASVSYIPQRQPPKLYIRNPWLINTNGFAGMTFDIIDTGGDGPFTVGARAADQSVVQQVAANYFQLNWWLLATAATNTGLSFITVSATNDAGLVSSEDVVVLVTTCGEVTSNFFKFPLLSLTNSGDLPWFNQAVVTRTGAATAQSGNIGNNQSSRLSALLTGPGTLSFWWKVSSESNYDWLEVTLDGVRQARISGEAGWTSRNVSVGAGTHLVEWDYTKDPDTSSGWDAGWVDEITFAPSQIIWIDGQHLVQNQMQMVLHPIVNQSFTLEGTTNFVNWNALLTSVAGTNAISFTDTNSAAPARYYRLRSVLP